jgi:3-methyladenine DNA glycosylase AlkC
MDIPMSEGEPPQKFLLKDLLFNRQKVAQIAREIERVHPSFKTDEFVRDVVARFPELELKARIDWISRSLGVYLPNDYRRAVNILLSSLPAETDPELSDNDFGDFIYAPYADFVAKHGCTKSHLGFSLRALKEITTRFSAEDAIRQYLNEFPKETLKALTGWSKDSHYHVRRLCSEGTRPKLPWSQKITIPITASIPMLDNLFYDKTRYVMRSVANHINDISKIDPDLAIKTLERWRSSGKQDPKEMEYIVRHALRTLIKQGNPEAMRLLGYSLTPRVHVTDFTVPKSVAMNTALNFSITVRADEDTNIIADYITRFQNKVGKLTSQKVFKLKTVSLNKGQSAVLAKQHMFRVGMTTRTLYHGRHEIEIQINGKSYGKRSFQLE